MSLKTPEKVRKLQRTLYAKAKEKPNYRFYLLYDKVYRRRHAGVRLPQVQSQRRSSRGWTDRASRTSRRTGRRTVAGRTGGRAAERRATDRQPVRRVLDRESRTEGSARWASRRSGTEWCRRRRCWSSEPIFEADLEPEQYGYRPKRSAQDAVRQVHALLNRGYREVVDADLSGYFDTIPHAELMKSVARRISDRQMLKSDQDVAEGAGRGRLRERDRRGGPEDGRQGNPARVSDLAAAGQPVLSAVHAGLEDNWDCENSVRRRIVNYADDFVICCRREAEEALQAARGRF